MEQNEDKPISNYLSKLRTNLYDIYGNRKEELSEISIELKNITVNDPEILEQQKNDRVSFGNKIHMDLERELKQYPITPTESFKDNAIIQSYPNRSQVDFDKLIEETSKYYNANLLVKKDTKGNIMEIFSKSKVKIVTINDKIIKYTHCIPTDIVIIKLTWKQKLKLLLGLKVNAIVNTYLNNGKVELTVLKIEE